MNNFKMFQCFYIRLLLLMFATQLPRIDAVFTSENCKTLSADTNCQCTSELAHSEIECASAETNGKFNLRIGPGKNVKIECEDIAPEDYEILPKLKIGYTKIMQIKQCPLPNDEQPIAKLFTQLGIERVNYFAYAIDESSGNVTQQHLSGLEKLQHLRLSVKSQKCLPSNLFQNLKSLVWLDLRSNNLTLSESLLEPLPNLTYLDLGHNFLERLPAGVFKNQQKLQHLNLWSNRLRTLTKEAFRGAEQLVLLDLSSNEIETFEHDVFSFLGSLRSLDLNMNKIRELPSRLFAKNKHLTEFRLVNNKVQLKTLPPALFANLTFLEEVRLICGLEQVPADLFANATKLTNLTMKNNMLKTLPEHFFKYQHNLYDLDLSNNRLENLPDTLFGFTTNLIELRLSHNQLVEISSELFKPLVNLELLQLDSNNLVSISFDAFRDTANLRFLNLANNEIDFADPLDTTSLDTTSLDSLDEDFAFDTTSPFRFLFKLRELNLRNNSIMYLHKDWRTQLLELRKLDLSYNNINLFSDRDLRFLSKHVKHVNLSHNLIEEINFNGISNMELHADAHTILFDLNDNPLHCDCVLLHFLQFIFGELNENVANKFEILTNNLHCEGPPALKEKEIIDLSYMELVCPLDDHNSQEKLCPQGCECLVRPVDLMLIINCSYSDLTRIPLLPTVPILKGIELIVSHNRLEGLPLNVTPGYIDVVALHAADNQLQELNLDNLPKNLEFLDVRHNLLENLSAGVLNFLNSSTNMQAVFLTQNPWTCDCEVKPLLEFAQSAAVRRKFAEHDMQHLSCVVKSSNLTSSLRFRDISVGQICPAKLDWFFIIGLTIAISILTMGLCTIVCRKYGNGMCRCFDVKTEDDDKYYDAFVSYAPLDEHYIIEHLKPELENGPIQYRLCLPRRDWIVGDCFTRHLVRSVNESQRTIVVLSQNFIKTVWTDTEFRLAHKTALSSIQNRLIIIIYGEIDDFESLDTELKMCLRASTYLTWGDVNFWKKLRAVLPQNTCIEKLEKEMSKLEICMA
ncbi:protein toll-like [Bactrocera dorsalis]|uniref:Protein toll-like n=2 Tax=Bactrocera dorsalis TaxID=27457 RepID=A0A8N4QAC1_BACDO|nr:protein toll-like [Bactrocera dorsalis]